MADVIKTKSVVQVVAQFADEDTRTISFQNPIADPAAALKAFTAYAKNNKILISDKTGSELIGFSDAKIFSETSTVLDLAS